MNLKLFLPIYIIYFVLSLVTVGEPFMIFTLPIIVLLQVLTSFGKIIALREIMAFHAVIVYVLFPYFGFTIYNRTSEIANLWVRHMDTDYENYYRFTLPAILAYIIGLNMFSGKIIRNNISLDRLKEGMANSPGLRSKIYVIIVIGFVCNILEASGATAGGSLSQVVVFLSLFIFVAILFIYFDPNIPFKPYLLAAVVGFFLYKALQTSMFTILVYMGATLSSIIFLGREFKLYKKIMVVVIGFMALAIIQTAKGSLRSNKFEFRSQERSKIFQSAVERFFSNPGFVFENEPFFFLYSRFSNGINLSSVMNYMPRKKPHDNGDLLFTTIFSSVVPRVFWPDKPNAGGLANMKYYTGKVIETWSTNIGPIGEGYGAFGVYGGITYMFCIGLFVSFALFRFLSLNKKFDLLILWFPLLFYQTTYSVETDTLQLMNSFIKGAMFLAILYRIFSSLFISGKRN